VCALLSSYLSLLFLLKHSFPLILYHCFIQPSPLSPSLSHTALSPLSLSHYNLLCLSVCLSLWSSCPHYFPPKKQQKKKTLLPWSASELYRLSYRRLSVKLDHRGGRVYYIYITHCFPCAGLASIIIRTQFLSAYKCLNFPYWHKVQYRQIHKLQLIHCSYCTGVVFPGRNVKMSHTGLLP
jgi:hypothetical protein